MRRSYGLVCFFALVFSTGFLLTAWPGIAMEVADGPFETGEADPSIRILAEPSQKGAGPQGPPVANAVGGVRVDSFPHPTLGSYEREMTWSVGFLETSEGRLWWSFGSFESPSVDVKGSYVGCLASEEGIVLYTSGSCASWFAYGGESNKMRPGETRADMDRRSSAGLALMRAGGEVVDQLAVAPNADFDGEGLKRLIRGAAAISMPRACSVRVPFRANQHVEEYSKMLYAQEKEVTSIRCENAAQCDDGDLCTVDACDETTKLCVRSPYIGCDDDNVCTEDLCRQGECEFVPREPCMDCSTCTRDTCHPQKGCQFEPRPCDPTKPETCECQSLPTDISAAE
jgi:hypothetical protein